MTEIGGKNRIRILEIIPSYKPAYVYGGPIYSVGALCEALVLGGCQVKVLTTNANGKVNLNVKTGSIQLVDGVEVIYHTRWTGDHSSFSPALLITLFRSIHQYDVIHLHSWWNLVIVPALLLCRIKGVRPVLSPRGSLTPYTAAHRHSTLKSMFHRLAGKRLLSWCFIHATSLQEKEDIASMVNPQRIFVLPNLLKLPVAFKRHEDSESVFRLIYLGRIEPKKNLEFMLDVLLTDFPVPYRLEIIGEGEDTYIKALKERTATVSGISWLGPIHGDAKWQYLANADVILLPSFNENYGNVILEALSQGTPAIVSDKVGLKDYLVENRFGWVVPNTPEAWRSCLVETWHNQAERARIRNLAPQKIQQDFSTKGVAGHYMAMYKEIIDANSQTEPV